ncbi:MAG: hypothetical protein ACT4PU_07320 [Planctomycetota bacterium]
MTPVYTYLTGLAVTVFVSLTAALVLRRPLQRLLVELCGTESRAAFWTAFSNLTLVLAPLLGAMHRRPGKGADLAPALEVAAQLEWALAGLLFSVLAIGVVLGRFIAAQDRSASQVRSPREQAAGGVPALATSGPHSAK